MSNSPSSNLKMNPSFILRVKRNIPKLLRFGFVGMIGAVVNLGAYYVTTTVLNWGINSSAVGAFVVAVTHNYVLNHHWTFRAENQDNQINFLQYAHYVLGNIFGLLVNLAMLNIFIGFVGVKFHLVGQAIGILCGMAFNYVIAKKFVFILAKSAN